MDSLSYFIPQNDKDNNNDIVLSLEDYPNVINNINNDIETFMKKMSSLNIFIVSTKMIYLNKRIELIKNFKNIKNRISEIKENIISLLKLIEIFSNTSESEKQIYDNYFEKYENINEGLLKCCENFIMLQTSYKSWALKYNGYLSSKRYSRFEGNIDEKIYNDIVKSYKKYLELSDQTKILKAQISTLKKKINHIEMELKN